MKNKPGEPQGEAAVSLGPAQAICLPVCRADTAVRVLTPLFPGDPFPPTACLAHLGAGSLQSPLLLAFVALEKLLLRTLPKRPKRTCSHLPAPSAVPSTPPRAAGSEVWGRPDGPSWLPGPSCSACVLTGSGWLGPPVSSSGSNRRNSIFPWTCDETGYSESLQQVHQVPVCPWCEGVRRNTKWD